MKPQHDSDYLAKSLQILLQLAVRYTVKPQMITLQPHERLHITIDENVDNTNPIDYIITERIALIIISSP